MRIRDAFRVAGRPRRVAHRGGASFVDLRPREARLLGREQLFVSKDVAGQSTRVAFRRAGHDVRLDGLEVGCDARKQGNEGIVDDDDLVLGVVDDVRQLVREEPQVQRVHHSAHTRNGEIRLEMLLRVPAERSDAVAGFDAESLQCGREPLCSVSYLCEGRAAVGPALEGGDFAIRIDGAAMTEDHADRQGEVLHRALHRGLHALVRLILARAARARPALTYAPAPGFSSVTPCLRQRSDPLPLVVWPRTWPRPRRRMIS